MVKKGGKRTWKISHPIREELSHDELLELEWRMATHRRKEREKESARDWLKRNANTSAPRKLLGVDLWEEILWGKPQYYEVIEKEAARIEAEIRAEEEAENAQESPTNNDPTLPQKN